MTLPDKPGRPPPPYFYPEEVRVGMPESNRPFQSLVLAFLLAVGGLITLAAGAGYMENMDVSEYVASIDIIAGIILFVAGLGCLVGRPVLWKLCFASLIVEIVAGVAMMTVTIAGGILLVIISALFLWWIHTSAIRKWFGV